MWFVLWNLSTISHRASSLVTLLPTTSHVSNVAIVMVFNSSQIYRLINLQPNCKKWSNGTGCICYFWVISQYYLDALWWRPTENRTQEDNSKVCSLLVHTRPVLVLSWNYMRVQDSAFMYGDISVSFHLFWRCIVTVFSVMTKEGLLRGLFWKLHTLLNSVFLQ